jgi:hypothetical protein
MPLIDVLKVFPVALPTARLEIADGKRSAAVWAGNATDVHMPRLLGKSRVNAGDEAAKEWITSVVLFGLTLPHEPVRADEELWNGQRQRAVRAVKGLGVAGGEPFKFATVKTGSNGAEPKGFVVYCESVATIPASV